MAAKVITLAHQKGGGGKSTLTMLLAGVLGDRGYQVIVMGGDPQGSAERWGAAAPDDIPFPAKIMGVSQFGNRVHQEIKKFIADADYILVDCPPAENHPLAESAILVSDLLLMPMELAPMDLWALVPFFKAVERIRVVNPSLVTRVVPNKHRERTSLGPEVLSVIRELDEIQLTESCVALREVYKKLPGYGATVHQLGYEGKVAREEIDRLVDEVLHLLHGQEKQQEVVVNG